MIYRRAVLSVSTALFGGNNFFGGLVGGYGDPIMADAICDRIVHDSYTIVIDCKESMRKRKGVNEEG